MWRKRQLITQLWLALEDFDPLVNHGSWHLKIDTAETAVDTFCLKCDIIGEKQKKKYFVCYIAYEVVFLFSKLVGCCFGSVLSWSSVC